MPHLSFLRRFAHRAAIGARVGVVGVIAAMGVGAVLPRAAQAQILARPSLRISLGGIVSPDSDVRHNVGSPFPLGMAEISVPQLFGNNSYVGVGYGERRRSGNDFRVIPITLTRLYVPPVPTKALTGYPYGGAGLAAYLLRGRTNEAGQSNDAEEKTAYGFTTIVGYQLPNAYFIEARYNAVTGSARGMNPGGLWVMLGLRL